MMINKAEDELGIKIFNRSKFPVEVTPTGMRVIEQAKRVLYETAGFKEIINEEKDKVKKVVIIGITPSLATYITPLILPKLSEQYPQLKVRIVEAESKNIVAALKTSEMDMGVLTSPVTDEQLNDVSVLQEKFYLYVSDKEELAKKETVIYKDIDMSRLWLFENECSSINQMMLAHLRKKEMGGEKKWVFESGCYQTLINLVDEYGGMTLVPQLATKNLTGNRLSQIKQFESPEPERAINIATNKNLSRNKLIELVIKGMRQDLNFAVSSLNKMKETNLLRHYQVGEM
jgi:LysR family hydrogen peroxide-inducible transcriptional activator